MGRKHTILGVKRFYRVNWYPLTPENNPICDVTGNFDVAYLSNHLSKVYDPIHYFDPLSEIYAMQ